MIRLVNSDNERDLNLLTRYTNFILSFFPVKGGRREVVCDICRSGEVSACLGGGASKTSSLGWEDASFLLLWNYFLGGLFVSSERKIEAITGL